jgi:phosphoribosylaminoimidazole-succinocarboxamide synthase
MAALLHSSLFGLPVPRVGKVRDVYDLGDEVLIVATDRISAFDAVMANGIPEKGCVLNQMSAFWFENLKDVCPNHVLSFDFEDVQSRCKKPQPELCGRTMLARKAKTLPVECVARGYICGSLYKEYISEGQNVHNLDLPAGLLNSERLPEVIFSPATKADSGHDENISFSNVVDIVGRETAEQIRNWTLELFSRASQYSESKGLILADTKFEFGETADGIILIDEILTPDSSRFWDASLYEPGKTQPSFDKQFVRDYLETSGWDKNPPGPQLPEDIVSRTRAKYLEAFDRIVGTPLLLPS